LELPECKGAHYQTARWLFSKFWVFCQFLTTRLYEGKHPDYGSIFPCRKTILFDNIIHLLHSAIHCDLDHSGSFLHKSRDGFRSIFWDYQTVRGHCTAGGCFEFWGGFIPFLTTRLHGSITPMMAAFPPPKTDHFQYYYYYTLAFTATKTTLAPYSTSHVTAFDQFFPST